MSVAENIKRIRKKRGFTQKELGILCDINEANIRKYENNRQNPKIETLQKIANALEVNVTELLDLPQLQNNFKDMPLEEQNINNIISMIENLGFKYINISEDDKIIVCHDEGIGFEQYFHVALSDINKIIEEYENAKLNKLKLLLEKEELEAIQQKILLLKYETKKMNEYTEKFKTVTTEEKNKIIKQLQELRMQNEELSKVYLKKTYDLAKLLHNED